MLSHDSHIQGYEQLLREDLSSTDFSEVNYLGLEDDAVLPAADRFFRERAAAQSAGVEEAG
eukprot:SAG11_NODE_3820_length_2209_cov_1.796209_5_plen_61_part_00